MSLNINDVKKNPDSIIGLHIGKLTVESINCSTNNTYMYNCKCDCGESCIKTAEILCSDDDTFQCCNNHMVEFKNKGTLKRIEDGYKSTLDMIGKTYCDGLFTVIGLDHIKTVNGKNKYFLKCRCNKHGVDHIIDKSYLIYDPRRTCSCVSNTFNNAPKCFKNSYQAMKSRCDNPNNVQYYNYGGRGITYDPKWKDPFYFYQDMYESYCKHVEEYGEDNTSIDRIDVNGDYYKENCKWSTNEEQANNKRNNKIYTIQGYPEIRHTVREFCNLYADEGVTYEIVRNKLRNSTNYATKDNVIINFDVFVNEKVRSKYYKPIIKKPIGYNYNIGELPKTFDMHPKTKN